MGANPDIFNEVSHDPVIKYIYIDRMTSYRLFEVQFLC